MMTQFGGGRQQVFGQQHTFFNQQQTQPQQSMALRLASSAASGGDEGGAGEGGGGEEEDGGSDGGDQKKKKKDKQQREGEEIESEVVELDTESKGEEEVGAAAEEGEEGEEDETPTLIDYAVESAETSGAVRAIYDFPDPPDDLSEVVVLPTSILPVFPRFKQLVDTWDPVLQRRIRQLTAQGKPFVGVFWAKNAEEEGARIKPVTSTQGIAEVGTLVQVLQESEEANGCVRYQVVGHRRIRATEQLEGPGVLTVGIEDLVDEPFEDTDTVRAMSQELVKTVRDNLSVNAQNLENVPHNLRITPTLLRDPALMSDLAAALGPGDPASLQAVLENLDVPARLEQTLTLLKQEALRLQLQRQIGRQVEEKLSRSQKEHLLMEQLNAIKKELGQGKGDKGAIIDKFRERIADGDKTFPPDVLSTINEEIVRLETIDANSSEFNVTRNYVDWLTALPWGVTTVDNIDLHRAEEILNEDHYGMAKAKERVLEFIAVSSLLDNVHGKIICFSGPPGVGKTSIAKSIARALDRKFYRFSVGGLNDVAEVKGHRRTYVAAMPGKVVQCLKQTQSENPLILLDEIDKIGSGMYNPTGALLELLDPEQNKNFLDHYLDVPVDLGKALFVCTANSLDTIPAPLLDRMEIIELSGYVAQEKEEIAKKYLIPQANKESGTTAENVVISDTAIGRINAAYCRESGVRNLKKHIEQITRKAAFRIVRDGESPVIVDADNLRDFVGVEKYPSDREYAETPPGVAMGLAFTQTGGATLYIETIATSISGSGISGSGSGGDNLDEGQGKSTSRGGGGGGIGSFRVTGRLGDVMKESSQIAYTYAQNYLQKLQPDNDFFRNAAISMHIPEGAVPKDGPSAGVTMVTAMLSLALNRPVSPDLSMTGEVSLTGKVWPVGGLKEKIIAAKRAGIRRIILPRGCAAELEEVPDFVRDGIDFTMVDYYDEVFAVAFPEGGQGEGIIMDAAATA